MFEILTFSVQAEVKYISRLGDTFTSLVQVSDRYISFWRSILFTDCWLHKQVSCFMQGIFNDRAACSKLVQADTLRVWLALDFNI